MPPAQLQGDHDGPGASASCCRSRADRTPRPTPQARETADLVESLMGRKPELRFEFIQENAKFVRDLDV